VRTVSLAATTAAALVALLVWASPQSVLATAGAPSSPRYVPTASLDDVPASYPDQADISTKAEQVCGDLPLPRPSARDVRRCQAYFVDAATLATLAAYETPARTPQQLAIVLCGEPDCSGVLAAVDLAGLSKYEWPRVRLTSALSVWEALSYVSRSVS
jgi:hypothetical protein